MSDTQTSTNVGRIIWRDLTVRNADEIRDFYKAVIGWEASGVDVGGYEDYNMIPPGSEEPAAGICYARGVNKDVPPQWMIYITVEDLDASIAACERLGGKVVVPVKDMGSARLVVIQDPAGAVATLYQQM